MKRVVYFGTAPFALPALRALQDHICLVVTQPDAPSGRGMNLQPSWVAKEAEALGLEVAKPIKSRSKEFVEHLASLDADLFVVAAYGQILSKSVLDLPKYGCINLHGSILPRWRGAAPVQRCIEAGDQESGVTLMLMDEGMDTGGIIAIDQVQIGKDETSGDLYDRLAELSGDMITQWIERLLVGDFEPVKQNDAEATYAPKVTKADGELSWDSASEAYLQYRAFTPVPGVYLETNLGKLKIHQMNVANRTGSAGEVLDKTDGLVVGMKEGSIVLTSVQPPGKARMHALDWANGARLAVGSRLN